MKKFSEINPTKALKEYFELNGVVSKAIYSRGERPASGLPYDFIDIVENGTISSESVAGGLKTCKIACSIYVELNNGVVNDVKNSFIMDKIEEALPSAIAYDGYEFTLDFKNLITDAKHIVTDYSTKTLNINAKIL